MFVKALIAPDKFKGTLSSSAVAEIISQTLEEAGIQTSTSPLADGGEGTVDAVLFATNGQKIDIKARNPLGKPVDSYIGLYGDNQVVIEMAAASGLHLIQPSEFNPLKTSTYGTGELIKAALDKNASSILIGVGGSATNDGGMGCANALGVHFLDSSGKELEPIGANLIKVADIDLSGLDPRVEKTLIGVAVDVDNPFYGIEGAAYIYGPQKGADEKTVELLDEGLKGFALVVEQSLGVDLQDLKGSGAAGGLAGGLVSFLGAIIRPGTKYICKILGLEEKIKQADFVITGEGRVDEQTLHGKAPTGVIDLAKKYNKPIFMIAGQLGEGYQKIEQEGVKLFKLAANEEEAIEAQANPKPAIERAVKQIINELRIKN